MTTNTINFLKMVGSGNDFVMIDNRNNIFDTTNKDLIQEICNRTQGIGADGILLVEKSQIADFKMRILNSDGSEAEMCGNGARCMAYFVYNQNIVGKKMKFETLAGIIEGEVFEESYGGFASVKVKMINPHSMRDDLTLDLAGLGKKNIYSINTGVPHAVIFVDDIYSVDVQNLGNFVRYNELFAPKGTNVNFVKIKNFEKNEIFVRTYERGVEGETLSCGSGSTASALFSALQNGLKSPVLVHTKSGEILKIHFENFELETKNIKNVYLEGFVKIVFEGKLDEKILK